MSVARRSADVLTLLMRSRLEADCLAVYLESRFGRGLEISYVASLEELESAFHRLGRAVILDRSFCAPARIPRLVSRLVQSDKPVIVLTDSLSDELIHAAALAGVYSAFNIHEPLAGLVDQVDAILRGQAWGQHLTGNQWSAALNQEPGGLTDRELDVVMHYLDGREPSIRDVADEMGISPNTVRAHLANVRKKLGGRPTKNTLALRTALVEKGWLPSEGDA